MFWKGLGPRSRVVGTGLSRLMCSTSEVPTPQEFRDLIAGFAAEHVAPRAEEIDRSNSFPKDVNLWQLMGSFGLHGEHCMLTEVSFTSVKVLDLAHLAV